MWFGVGFLLVLAGLIALGQWYVTRPTRRRAIDPSRVRAANDLKYPHDQSHLSDGGFGL